ncbi:NAD(P)-dependent oxidoreductase [Pseudochelatococcus sp. B33]
MHTPTILLTDPLVASVMDLVRSQARIIECSVGDAAAFRSAAAEAEAIIVRSPLPDDIFDHAPNMLAAVRHGAGFDMIPVENATRNGVAVANVPGANSSAVAEHAIAQMIRFSRLLPLLEGKVRDRAWNEGRRLAAGAREIAGRTVGIVGVGAVGTALARICSQAFGMSVLGYRRNLADMPAFVEGAPLEDLFARSDFVVLCCPLTSETRGLVDAGLLNRMRPDAVLVNVARGAVVNEADLIDALTAGRIAGAVLDVLADEPPANDNPLLDLPNVMLTPHSSGVSVQSAERLGRGAFHEVMRILSGEKPTNLVNPDCWPQLERRRRTILNA